MKFICNHQIKKTVLQEKDGALIQSCCAVSEIYVVLSMFTTHVKLNEWEVMIKLTVEKIIQKVNKFVSIFALKWMAGRAAYIYRQQYKYTQRLIGRGKKIVTQCTNILSIVVYNIAKITTLNSIIDTEQSQNCVASSWHLLGSVNEVQSVIGKKEVGLQSVSVIQ